MTILVALIALASVMQPNSQRLFVGLAYSVLLIASDLLLSNSMGLLYYYGSAVFDVATIIIISRVAKVSSMVLTIQKICLVSILLNFFGWVMWELYMPPVMYNSLFIALYVYALLTLVRRSSIDVGEYTLGYRWFGFRTNYNSSILGRIKHDHPARP